MLEFKFDVQLLIAGENLSEDDINEFIIKNYEGDSLLVFGDDDLIKLHYHTNKPWEVIEYCDSLGDIHDIIIENMQRQADGLQG